MTYRKIEHLSYEKFRQEEISTAGSIYFKQPMRYFGLCCKDWKTTSGLNALQFFYVPAKYDNEYGIELSESIYINDYNKFIDYLNMNEVLETKQTEPHKKRTKI